MRESGSSPSSPPTTLDSAIALSAARLQERLIRQIEQGKFCSAGPLGELAIHAREIKRSTPVIEHRVLAFVLEMVRQRLADDQIGRPVHLSEIDAIRKLFHKPITEAAVVAIADDLVKAISEVVPIPS
jgi:hypothetical protein